MGSLFSHCDEDGSSLDLIKPEFSCNEELSRVNSYIYFSGLLVDLLKDDLCVLILQSFIFSPKNSFLFLLELHFIVD